MWSVFGISTFILSLIFVRLFCRYAWVRGLLDIPNERSSHQVITPRGGGIVFVLLWLASLSLALFFDMLSFKDWLFFVPTTAIISLLGFWDDHQELSAQIRLLIQAIIAFICIYILDGLPTLHLFKQSALWLGWFGYIIGVVGIVWSVNLYNFMDGIDGVAGIEALFVFSIGGLLFLLSGQPHMALITWAMVMGVAGFLVWNWPEARVFMGDVGSYCLGFLVAILSIIGDRLYNIPIALWIILFGVFWFDATVTLIRRLILKKHWATPHRDHACHRLQAAGFTHQQILTGVIVLNIILAIVALVTFFYPRLIPYSMLFTLLFLTSVYLIIERINPLTKDN